MVLDPGGTSGSGSSNDSTQDDAEEQLTDSDPGSGDGDDGTQDATSPSGSGGGFTSGGGDTTTQAPDDGSEEPDEDAEEQLTESDPGSGDGGEDTYSGTDQDPQDQLTDSDPGSSGREPDPDAAEQLTRSDPGSRDVTQMQNDAIQQQAQQAAEEAVETSVQEGVEGRAGRSVEIDGRTVNVQAEAQGLEQDAIDQAEWADDPSDVAVVVRDGRLVAVPSRSAAVDIAAGQIEDDLQGDFENSGQSEEDAREQIREDVASDWESVDADDVVLEEDGDTLRVDVEATAARASGEAEPGLLAKGISFGAEQVRDTPVGSTLPVVAASLRTRTGLDVPIGDNVTVPLPGEQDVDAAVEALEPANEAFQSGVSRATGPARYLNDKINTHLDIDATDIAGAGPGVTAAASETVRQGVIEGVESGGQSLSPAAVGQDTIRLTDLGLRGTERAARQGSEDEIQGALNFGGAVASEAADRAPEAAARTAAVDPVRAVEVPVAAGTALLAGAAFGTGVAATPRAARATARSARNAPRRLRQARRGLNDDVAAFREDTRGMAGGGRTVTKTKEREVTVEMEESRELQAARELSIEDFESPDELAREQALLAEKAEMAPRRAFETEEDFQRELTQRAASRLDMDEEVFIQKRRGEVDSEEAIETVVQQQEAEGFASPSVSTTIGATAFASREAQAEEEELAFAPAELEAEVGGYETTREAEKMGEDIAEAEVEVTREQTMETQDLTTEITAEDTTTQEMELTATTRPRGRSRRTRDIELPRLNRDPVESTDVGGSEFAKEFEFGVASPEDVLSGLENDVLDDT